MEVEASDLLYSAKGYDPKDVIADRNSQIPVDRLLEYAENGVLVYLYGGAFSFGPVKEHWDYIARISKQTGMS